MQSGLMTDPSDQAALARARQALVENNRLFHALESYALDAEDPNVFAGRASFAFEVGARHPPGVMVSTALEQRLRAIGLEQVSSGSAVVRHGERVAPAPGRIERVLHVVTEGYAGGGHTRLVERWMLSDRERTPTVAITDRAAVLTIPPTLQAAARESGGAVVAITGDDLITRARNLRALAAQHDLVVLHIHMHDVVPALALADPVGRPPTILFNHASHQIWAGIGVADVVANLRKIDAEYTRERRGLQAAASLVLPIPVGAHELPGREQARRQLGLADDLGVILAVGSAYKVGSVVHPRFTDLIAAVLNATADTQLIAVGPSQDAEWAELERAWGGRLHRSDVLPHAAIDLLMSAADVLLDTWPISGGTTLVEACYSGLPIVSLGNWHGDLAMLRVATDGLDDTIIQVESVDAAAQAVAELLADPDRRYAIGMRGRMHVESDHVSGWSSHMEEIVSKAIENSGAASPPAVDPPAEYPDWECLLYLAYDAVGNIPSPESLMLRRAAELHPSDRAPNELVARERIAAILAELRNTSRRAVAAPAIDQRTIADLVAEIRGLVVAGAIDRCIVAIPASALADAIPLFERSLADGTDVEIELVPADGVDAITRPGDRVLTAPFGV